MTDLGFTKVRNIVEAIEGKIKFQVVDKNHHYLELVPEFYKSMGGDLDLKRKNDEDFARILDD